MNNNLKEKLFFCYNKKLKQYLYFECVVSLLYLSQDKALPTIESAFLIYVLSDRLLSLFYITAFLCHAYIIGA